MSKVIYKAFLRFIQKLLLLQVKDTETETNDLLQ